jgi:hypothetical protein
MLYTEIALKAFAWFIKYWKVILISLLITTIIAMKSCSDRKIEELNSKFAQYQTQTVEDREKIITSVLESQGKMLNAHIEIMEGLRNDIENLNGKFNSTNASYDRLLKTLGENRSVLNELSKDSLINYTINLTDSLGEIGAEAKLYAREADTSAIEAEALLEMIENYREGLRLLKLDLESKGIKVNIVDYEELKSK